MGKYLRLQYHEEIGNMLIARPLFPFFIHGLSRQPSGEVSFVDVLPRPMLREGQLLVVVTLTDDDPAAEAGPGEQEEGGPEARWGAVWLLGSQLRPSVEWVLRATATCSDAVYNSAS